MALLIKGDEITDLVERYCALTGMTNKSEAVRRALAAQIEALSAQEPLANRVRDIQARALAAGFVSSGNHKADMDEFWSE